MTLEVKRNNPAGRLYYILDEANKMSPDLPIKEMWRKVFRVESGAIVDIFPFLKQMHVLVQDVESRLRKIDGITLSIYMLPFPDIKAMLNVSNFDLPWREFRSGLIEANMRSIAHCAEVLAKQPGTDETIEDDKLSELQKEVEELTNEVASAELDETLKRIILESLDSIRRAILEYIKLPVNLPPSSRQKSGLYLV